MNIARFTTSKQIDLAVSAMDERLFNQPGFKGYNTMEQFLVKSLLHSDFLKVAEEYDYVCPSVTGPLE